MKHQAMMSNNHKRTLDLVTVFLALAGLYWFTASFFLAKRSLSARSSCDEAGTLLKDVLGLTEEEVRRTAIAHGSNHGCWMNRTSDSLVILLVDALRFDFAYYSLPKSIGNRLKEDKETHLFQFVADPPTVTMQRLKALTTGGLPTFADISANFGGGNVEEDTWIQQIVSVNPEKRGVESVRTAFVGDDTWEDLFPGKFNESYPYPSFNTRDLNTVDNGCLKHIPDMLRRIRTKTRRQDELELAVVHFLGVDHVGHTYGPHNKYMDAKLKQMDNALAEALDHLDASDACHTTFIFGDHGMTEDGNHGGSTLDETHAALFVHSSTACRDRSLNDASSSSLKLLLEGPSSTSELVHEAAFTSISQIDLVSTLSIALGLPIPYANLGSFVPSLLPDIGIHHTTAALALNAAQVWRYLTVYSATANKLPDLEDLKSQLEIATDTYKEALVETDRNVDTDEAYQRTASLYKIFLREALKLGQRVWTRFDMAGMIGGIVVLCVGLVLYTIQSWRLSLAPFAEEHKRKTNLVRPSHYWEIVSAVLFMVYECGLLTFGNSYILEEEHSIMFSLSVLTLLVAYRMWSEPGSSRSFLWLGVLLIPVLGRLNENAVTGHGLDPSIPLHSVHHPFVFLTSLGLLGALRWVLLRQRYTDSLHHTVADTVALLCLAASWWEKRSVDPERNGYTPCQIALAVVFVGLPFSIFQSLTKEDKYGQRMSTQEQFESDIITSLSKLLIAIMAVTGPSTATSLVFYSAQMMALYSVSSSRAGLSQVHSVVLAALLKLVTRQIFFLTNHGCAFNRLQYSAAFAATRDFNFMLGGISLFLNTFGWEVAGLAIAWLLSYRSGQQTTWRIYTIYQLVEAVFSCISVSVLRRHLMVWDIYAPRFIFSTIFSMLNLLAQLSATVLLEKQ